MSNLKSNTTKTTKNDKFPTLSASLNHSKIKHHKKILNGKPTGNYFIYVNKKEKPTIEPLINYAEHI